MKTISPAQAMFAKAMNAHYNKKDAQKRGSSEISTVDYAERQRRNEEEVNRLLARAGLL